MDTVSLSLPNMTPISVKPYPYKLSCSIESRNSGISSTGVLFVNPGEKVYEGMIVGEHNRDNDLNVNACKPKKLSNMRASSKDEGIILTPVTPMTLEKAIEFINDDELVEVTPKNIRLRKSILSASSRYSAGK